jgi:methionyl aminopeptidase
MTARNRIKTTQEVKDMRTSGAMLSSVLKHLTAKLQAGMTTGDLAHLAAEELNRLGGKPAFLGYQGFPDVICISINDEIVHGIPGSRVLKDGDIVGLDFGVNYNGMITDAAVTVGVGEVDAEAKRLMKATKEALKDGIKAVRSGARVGDISAAIEKRLRRDKLGVIEDLIGHGVGHEVHEEPGIPNYGKSGTGPKIVAGMTLAIEPMASLGTSEVLLGRDKWTVYTADGSLASHHEHTVLVTEEGAEILTA